MATLLYVWGRGDDGQIGVGDTTDQLLPVPIEHLRKEHVVSVVCGSGHTIALTKQGRIYTWGRGDDGRLGVGDHGWKYIPRFVESLAPETMRVISSGSYHSAAVSASGAVYTWGGGLFGKLGLGNESGRLSPARVEALQGKVIVALACGSRHTCALTNQGEVYSWGDNENGVTGHGTNEGHQYTPRAVAALKGMDVVSIGACGFHSGVVTAEGEVYSFGEGKFGRLGHGSEANCLIPRPVEALRGKRVIMFAAGGFHSCCVTDTGFLYSWGGGEHGQLGHGDRVNRNSPTLVEAFLGHVVTQISTGWSHNISLCDDGQVYSWGNGDHGKLGHGCSTRVTSPRLIEKFRGMRVVQVASYNEHTAALVALSSDALSSTSAAPLGITTVEDAETRFLRDLRNLFSRGLFSDVTFLVEGQHLSAHRAVLASRSDHFASMFLSGMRESFEAEIPIPNVRAAIFNSMLEFLYTNRIGPIAGDDAVELYVLADLYQIGDLRTLCKDLLVQSLTINAAPGLLISTHSFGIQELKDACLSYMVRHFDMVSKTPEFSDMSKELMLEVVQKRAPLSPLFAGHSSSSPSSLDFRSGRLRVFSDEETDNSAPSFRGRTMAGLGAPGMGSGLGAPGIGRPQ